MAFAPKPDDLFQSIVGAAGERDNGIPRAQHTEQGSGEGMGTGYKVVADQGIFTAEDVGQYSVQRLPADVAIAIAGGAGKHRLTHPVLDEGGQHLLGIVVGGFIDLLEDGGTLLLGLAAEGFDSLIYLEKRFFHGNLIFPLFCKISVSEIRLLPEKKQVKTGWIFQP